MSLHVETARLSLRPFAMPDADALFACITPGMTRFMAWDPPTREAFQARCEALVRDAGRTETQFVIRRADTGECLGATAVERPQDDLPELGIWMKEAAHGRGYGREAVEASSAGPRDRATARAFSTPWPWRTSPAVASPSVWAAK